VRVGRTWIEFHEGPFEPVSQSQSPAKKAKLVRPADPHEALAGTISDFVYVEPENDGQEFDATPSPMPHAEERAGPGATTLYNPNALHDLSESVSGISVMAPPKAKRLGTPVRINLPKRTATSFEADLSLQADARQVVSTQIIPDAKASRIGRRTANILIGCGILIATAMVLASGWILANG